ncbi:MAG: ABC transporter permease [Candidatus Limnocylindrales bacterium]
MGRWALRLVTIAILGFIYIPIGLVILFAFNSNRTASWPPAGFTLEWFVRAVESPGVRDAFRESLTAASGATVISLVLGTLAALAVSRFRFFGRESVSFLVVLPIALPGIVTGIALNATFTTFDINLGMATVIVGHATFCVVVVYNNVAARLRRTSRSPEEASGDLGAHAFETFRWVTFPAIRTALLAGGLLAFALSFDEIIVTTFTAGPVQTLPIFIFRNIRLANQAPIVNVAAVFALLLSVIPVYVAQRLAGAESRSSR